MLKAISLGIVFFGLLGFFRPVLLGQDLGALRLLYPTDSEFFPDLTREAFGSPQNSSLLSQKLEQLFLESKPRISFENIQTMTHAWDQNFYKEFFAQAPDFNWGEFQKKWTQKSAQFSPTEKALVICAASTQALLSDANSQKSFENDLEKDPSKIKRLLETNSSYFWSSLDRVTHLLAHLTSTERQAWQSLYSTHQKIYQKFNPEWDWLKTVLNQKDFDAKKLQEELDLGRMSLVLSLASYQIEEGTYSWQESDYQNLREALQSQAQWGNLDFKVLTALNKNIFFQAEQEYMKRYKEKRGGLLSLLNPLRNPLAGEGSITRPIGLLLLSQFLKNRAAKNPMASDFPAESSSLKGRLVESLPKGMSEVELENLITNPSNRDINRTLKDDFSEASSEFRQNLDRARRGELNKNRLEKLHDLLGSELSENFDAQFCEHTLAQIPSDQVKSFATEFAGKNLDPNVFSKLNPFSRYRRTIRNINKLADSSSVNRSSDGSHFSLKPRLLNWVSKQASWLMTADLFTDGALVLSNLWKRPPEINIADLNSSNIDQGLWTSVVEKMNLISKLKELVTERLFSDLRSLQTSMNAQRRKEGLPEIEFLLSSKSASATEDQNGKLQKAPLISGLIPHVYVLMKVKEGKNENNDFMKRFQDIRNGILIRFAMHFQDEGEEGLTPNSKVYWLPEVATNLQDQSPTFQAQVARAIVSQNAFFQTEKPNQVYIDPQGLAL